MPFRSREPLNDAAGFRLDQAQLAWRPRVRHDCQKRFPNRGTGHGPGQRTRGTLHPLPGLSPGQHHEMRDSTALGESLIGPRWNMH